MCEDWRSVTTISSAFWCPQCYLQRDGSECELLSLAAHPTLPAISGVHQPLFVPTEFRTITKGNPRQERSPVSQGNIEFKLPDETLNRNVALLWIL